MATLDPARDAVVVRIVYDGPPTSGKTTSLRSLAEQFGGRTVYTPEELAGRTVFFDWMEYVGGQFDGRPIRCQIVSAPGQRELASRRALLLGSADVVVFVADTSARGMAESQDHLDHLGGLLAGLPSPPVGLVVQANKRDLPDAQPLTPFQGRRGVAVIESVASSGEGLREAFVFAVRLALDRVRELSRLGLLLEVSPSDDPAGELLRRMRALPLDPEVSASWSPPAPSLPEASGPSPALPDARVAAGWVWPPVHGRILLQEASGAGRHEVQRSADGGWVADSDDGWRFHSWDSAVYADEDLAHAALIRWAQRHAALSEWLSPERCIALCASSDGTFRLWQVLRRERSLWSELSRAVASGDPAAVAEARQICERAIARWSGAPHELPCTLETVAFSPERAPFIGLMPASGREPWRAGDASGRLSKQLERLLRDGPR